jgi:membrane-associated phospholipid phosphatase
MTRSRARAQALGVRQRPMSTWYSLLMDTLTDDVVEPRYASMSRSRRVRLVGAAVIGFVVVAVFGLVVIQDRSPLDAFDRWGRQAEDWTDNHAALVSVLRVVEVTFATVGMVVWTTLVVVAVLSKRRFRAAAFAIVVMIATSLVTTAIKLALGRGRPEWQDATDLLSSKSFPSGHASSSAALAGILIFLAWSFLRRAWARWAVTVLAIGMWVVVCLDRVLLGRHYPSDVVAGSILGVSMVLLGIAVFDPARVRVHGGSRDLR